MCKKLKQFLALEWKLIFIILFKSLTLKGLEVEKHVVERQMFPKHRCPYHLSPEPLVQTPEKSKLAGAFPFESDTMR